MRRHSVWILPLVFVVLLGAALFVWQPWRARGHQTRPNIVLVTIDALRPDHLDPYGAERGLTPHLNRLAEEAVLFEETVTPTPLSAAGLASVLTGRLPIEHRLRGDLHGSLPNAELTLAEWLKDRGYQTSAFLGSRYPIDAHLTQGCDSLSAPLGPERSALKTVEAFASWIGPTGGSESPRFIWIHFSDPRGPWRATFPHCLEHLDDPYAGEIATIDDAIGRLVATLQEQNLLASTHLIVVGTSGEALGEQGELEHGVLLEASTLQVPWLWRLPESQPGEQIRIPGLTATTDVLPTIMDYVDSDNSGAARHCEGTSVRNTIEQNSPPKRKHLLVETFHAQHHFGWSPLVGLWSDGWLYVARPDPRLYNLRTAPHQPQPLIAETEAVAKELHQLLGAEISARSPNEEDAQTWETWGQGQPNPYKRVSLSSDLIEASRDLYSGDVALAQRRAERLVARFPDNPRIQALRAFTHLHKGEWVAAERGFRRILDHFSQACEARLGLAESMLAQNNAHEALAALGNQTPDSLGSCLWLLAPDPDHDFRHWNIRGLAEARIGNLTAARDCFQRAGGIAEMGSRQRLMRRFAEAVRILADARERIGHIHPRERRIIAQAALRLEVIDLGREILDLDALRGSSPDEPPPDPLTTLFSAYDLAAQGKLGPASSRLHRAMRDDVVEAENVIHIASILEQHGRHDNAVMLIEQALPQFPKSGELHFALAMLRAQDRATGQAKVSLFNALKRGFRDWDRLLNRSIKRICEPEDLKIYWEEPVS